jgi:hypothetical protein
LDQFRKTLGSPSVCFCLWHPPSCRHNSHLCPGGASPPDPPSSSLTRALILFHNQILGGVPRFFGTKILSFFSPGLGLREGWRRLIRYRSFFEFDSKCRRNLINYDFFWSNCAKLKLCFCRLSQKTTATLFWIAKPGLWKIVQFGSNSFFLLCHLSK